MRLAPEPLRNKKGLSSGTSSPREPSVGEEEFLALHDLVSRRTTFQAVVSITPAVLPTGSGLRMDHDSEKLPLAYGFEDEPSCTQDVQTGKEISSNFAFPAATGLDVECATATGVFGADRGSLDSSPEDTAVAKIRVSTTCAVATCWQGFMMSRGLVLGCTLALVAIIEVFVQVLRETVTGEESLENTLSRGSRRKTTLESIIETEEEWDEEVEGEELVVLGKWWASGGQLPMRHSNTCSFGFKHGAELPSSTAPDDLGELHA